MAKIDEQTLVEHLSEFRKRLIITIIFFIAAFLVSLLFCSDIYKLLTASFKQKLTVLGPNDILSIYLMLAGICAFSLTLPFTSYQLWAFIRPALKEKEAKAILSYVPATFILFVTGLSFGFFISSGLCILAGVIGLLRGIFSISLFLLILLFNRSITISKRIQIMTFTPNKYIRSNFGRHFRSVRNGLLERCC